MSARWATVLGIAVLAAAWLGPLPRMAQQMFAAHMVLHMTVIGLGAPLLAFGLGRPVAFRQRAAALSVAASLLDFAVIWLWHTPALHIASRTSGGALAFEQASFAGAALLLWCAALSAPPLAGAGALFLSAMHMVLLGALLGLAPRALFADLCGPGDPFADPMADQQLGGAIMIGIGSVVYFGGALVLAAQALHRPVRP